jgi:hypothetical protein
MDTDTLISYLNEEIARLTTVRRLLMGETLSAAAPIRRGPHSPEGRARIAAAQHKRWATRKGAA